MTDNEMLFQLVDQVAYCECDNYDREKVLDFVNYLIANNVVVQKQGEWLPYPSDMYMKCSVCGMEYPKSKMPKNVGYCPNPRCGAKMVKEDK